MMREKENIRTKIWVYAVVLFTSAFVVLLITAYSQIKLNRNINDYKSQIYSNENEKNKYQMDFANSKEVNDKLSKDNQKLQADLDSISKTLDLTKQENADAVEKYDAEITEYEKLCEAQADYSSGNVVQSAQILQGINESVLGVKAVEMFGYLADKAYNEAGKQLFDEGYKLYQDKSYSAAAEKFSLSRVFMKDGVYSDKCLYYLAYAEQKAGHIYPAVEYMGTLIQEYPTSTYYKSAQRFVKKYGGAQP